MAVVRISKGRFNPQHAEEVVTLLRQSEEALREPITALPGLLRYYVGIDEEKWFLTNVSVWDDAEHAHQKDTLAPMLAQRPLLEAVGVESEPITNHDVLWSITP